MIPSFFKRGEPMGTDIKTLIRVLDHFYNELDACMNHKDSKGGPFTTNDPILLGDFIVDAFNDYLQTAQGLTDQPMIQRMQPIVPASGDVPDDAKLGGRHPRLQKMHEVALTTRNLMMYLEGAVHNGPNPAQRELKGALALLEAVGRQLKDLERQHHNARLTGARIEESYWVAALNPIVEMYNQALALITEQADDPVLQRLFQPIELHETVEFGKALSQARVAQSCLLSYLTCQTNHMEEGCEEV